MITYIPTDDISAFYTTPAFVNNSVVMWGSSKDNAALKPYLPLCDQTVGELCRQGKSIIHGCGTVGVMGRIYRAAGRSSRQNKQGLPEQSIAVVHVPLWGDEDLDHCVIAAFATSERKRIELFRRMTNTFIIFPGSAATLQETATLIATNCYTPDDKKKIIVVGQDFFHDFIAQYTKLCDKGFINTPVTELFSVADSTDEILNLIG